VAAVELLGKGFLIWRSFIKDLPRLIHTLFSMSLGNEQQLLTTTAHRALMLVGTGEPKQFVQALAVFILDVHFSDSIPSALTGKTAPIQQNSAALLTLGSLIKKDPAALLSCLPQLVETVVRSLDPHVPYLRDNCLQAATKVLHALVKQYPMVSFHQETQRLAVGTNDSFVIIFDLKTANKWHQLEGHTGPITAVAFAPNGKMLASYSIEDCEVRFWQTHTSIFGIIGSNPHCLRSYRVSKVESECFVLFCFFFFFLVWGCVAHPVAVCCLQSRFSRRKFSSLSSSSGTPPPRCRLFAAGRAASPSKFELQNKRYLFFLVVCALFFFLSHFAAAPARSFPSFPVRPPFFEERAPSFFFFSNIHHK
jgi:WD40 repeat protein